MWFLVLIWIVLLIVTIMSVFAFIHSASDGDGFMVLMSMATASLCIICMTWISSFNIKNDWVELTPKSEFSAVTYQCQDLRTEAAYKTTKLRVMYQNINENFYVNSEIEVGDWMNNILYPGNKLLFNISSKPMQGTLVDVWLKYNNNGKYFWEKLGTVYPK